MADRVLVISWGQTVRGREQHALEVFEASVGYYAELRQAGRIEGFDVLLLSPNGLMAGCMVLRGTHAQLEAAAQEERFRRLLVDASLIVDDLRTILGYANEGVAEQMGLYTEAIGRVPQMA
jgi:hypothetical protein